MPPATLTTWARGYERRPPSGAVVRQGPVITSVPPTSDGSSIPFVGLIEATVVQAFRRSELSMQRLRKALEVLASEGHAIHPLASNSLFTDGATVLFDYARREGDGQLRLLTVVETGQRVFHEVIQEYLTKITFGDAWATELVVPVTRRPLLRIVPKIASGDPLFMRGGAPLSAVRSRLLAGEPAHSVARDFDVPIEDITEAIDALWPQAVAA